MTTTESTVTQASTVTQQATVTAEATIAATQDAAGPQIDSGSSTSSEPKVDDTVHVDDEQITPEALEAKQTEMFQRLAKVRDCKKQVLDMLDQLKAECDNDASKIDKATLAKLVSMYDGFAEQEENYVKMLQEMVELKREQVTATATEAQTLRAQLADITSQQSELAKAHPTIVADAVKTAPPVPPKPTVAAAQSVTNGMDADDENTADEVEEGVKMEKPKTQSGELERGYVTALQQQRDQLKIMAVQQQKLSHLQREKANMLAAESIAKKKEEASVLEVKAQMASERDSIDAKRAQLAALKAQVANIQSMVKNVEVDKDDKKAPITELKSRLDELHTKRARFDQLLANLDEGGANEYDSQVGRIIEENAGKVAEVLQSDTEEEAAVSTAKTDYANKVREQQTALDELLTERERLDSMQSQFTRLNTQHRRAESEMPQPAVQSARYLNPRMPENETRGMSEPVEPLGQSLYQNMLDGMVRNTSRSSSTQPSSAAGMSGEAQLLMWQQQMLTTSIMQQQLHQQSMHMQQMQQHIMNLTQALQGQQTDDTGTPLPQQHAYPMPPAMQASPFNPLAAYGTHPLSSQSIGNLFAPYAPPTPLANGFVNNAGQARSTSRLGGSQGRRTRSSSRPMVPQLQLSLSAEQENLYKREMQAANQQQAPANQQSPLNNSTNQLQADALYNEVAMLIAQNGDCPKYLLDMFRELQQIGNTSLRVHALTAIRQLLLSHRQKTIDEHDSRFSSMDSLASTSAVDDDEEYSNHGYSNQRALTTPDSNSRNAHVNALCKSMAKGEAKLRPIGEQRRSASSADVGQEMDMSILQPFGDAVIEQVVPFVQEKSGEKVNGRILTYIRKLVLTLTLTKVNETSDIMEKSVQLLIKQLTQALDETLSKYLHQRLGTCADSMLSDIGEVVTSELAFHKFMQDLHITATKEKTPTPSTLPPINTGRSTFRASSRVGSDAEQIHEEICNLVGATDD